MKNSCFFLVVLRLVDGYEKVGVLGQLCAVGRSNIYPAHLFSVVDNKHMQPCACAACLPVACPG
jgi:hypothetical protein